MDNGVQPMEAMGETREPSLQMQVLLRAAAQAICDSGAAGSDETVASVEEALLAQACALGATSAEQVALLASGPDWRLSVTGSGRPGVCAEVVGLEAGRGRAALDQLAMKRRRVVA
uniref:Uncharacterized protein n=1 Tax=Alexandrium catenella TaxID=2925 RepID=A0A7S1PPV6_ALECA|mmetsp:Transcript_105273/g.280284  ORF Transcript_105273/g.280284 Transcript_105273/m.280284 type:complete len:116 (+) Transcript_105273:66-413(+)